MSTDASILAKALRHAVALLEMEPKPTRLEAAERAAREFDLGPLDEEWLIHNLTNKPPEPKP